jgi:hypothetical protein
MDMSQAFRELFGTLAEQNHATLVPYLLEGVGGVPELNLPDLIHPNAAGQRNPGRNVLAGFRTDFAERFSFRIQLIFVTVARQRLTPSGAKDRTCCEDARNLS